MLNKIILQFNRMYINAFLLLLICLNIILASLCLLCIYIDTAHEKELFVLINNRSNITQAFLFTLCLSFGGSFLLDYANAKNNNS